MRSHRERQGPGTPASPIVWRMRAASTVVVLVFLLVAFRPLTAGVEGILLVLGLAAAAYYVKMHRQRVAELDESSGPDQANPL